MMEIKNPTSNVFTMALAFRHQTEHYNFIIELWTITLRHSSIIVSVSSYQGFPPAGNRISKRNQKDTGQDIRN